MDSHTYAVGAVEDVSIHVYSDVNYRVLLFGKLLLINCISELSFYLFVQRVLQKLLEKAASLITNW